MILKPSGVYCDGKKGFRSIELLISEISGFANLLSFRGQSFERFRRPHGPPYIRLRLLQKYGMETVEWDSKTFLLQKKHKIISVRRQMRGFFARHSHIVIEPVSIFTSLIRECVFGGTQNADYIPKQFI